MCPHAYRSSGDRQATTGSHTSMCAVPSERCYVAVQGARRCTRHPYAWSGACHSSVECPCQCTLPFSHMRTALAQRPLAVTLARTTMGSSSVLLTATHPARSTQTCQPRPCLRRRAVTVVGHVVVRCATSLIAAATPCGVCGLRMLPRRAMPPELVQRTAQRRRSEPAAAASRWGGSCPALSWRARW